MKALLISKLYDNLQEL